MSNDSWQLQDAKSKFSQLVENAMHNKPQLMGTVPFYLKFTVKTMTCIKI